MPNNPPTQDELDLIAFAAAEKDEHRPMISTADAGSDCPTFERLAEIIAAQAEAIDALETERDLWKSTAKDAEKERALIRDLSAKRRARLAAAEEDEITCDHCGEEGPTVAIDGAWVHKGCERYWRSANA